MRRIILALVISLFLFGFALAGEKNLIATWQQVLPVPNDLLKWELWYSDDQVNWTRHAEIFFVQEQTEYTTEFPFVSPDAEKKTWFFRMNAWDTSGNPSAWSNVAAITIDFEPPDGPINFQLTIKIVPQ